jgi:large subunit ribosomal protein L13
MENKSQKEQGAEKKI